MKKRSRFPAKRIPTWAYLLAAVLAAGLFWLLARPDAGHGNESGLLAAEEVAALEDLYGRSPEEVLDALRLSGEDIERRDESRMVLAEKRTVLTHPFVQVYLFSQQDPEGLYMVRLFYSEDALDRGLYEQLRSQAVARYGEPAVESTRTGINQFSDWDIGERTVLHLSLTESDIVIDYRGQLSRK